MTAALLALPTVGFAVPMDFSFSGSFAADDDVQLFTFNTDGSVDVTLRTYSYGGGTQADGTIVGTGGFDPLIALFDSSGALLAQNDDGFAGAGSCAVNFDPSTSLDLDACLVASLAAGDYIVALTQSDSFANGPNLTDDFQNAGDPFFTAGLGCSNGQFCDVVGDNRTRAWNLDILNVESAGIFDVPLSAPGALTLFGVGLLGVALMSHASTAEKRRAAQRG